MEADAEAGTEAEAVAAAAAAAVAGTHGTTSFPSVVMQLRLSSGTDPSFAQASGTENVAPTGFFPCQHSATKRRSR